jgi:hypothetical protein
MERQDGAGNPITTGSVSLTGSASPSAGATFGGSQFGTPITPSFTMNAGTSDATFWYGNTALGTSTITITGTGGYVTATQDETTTAAPAGLGMVVATGSTGTPVVNCGTPIDTSYTCAVTGVHNAGKVVFYAEFVDSSGAPVVYSSTQDSTIAESGQNTGTATITAGSSSSSPTTLTASHSGFTTQTSTLTFGPYTLTITVSS